MNDAMVLASTAAIGDGLPVAGMPWPRPCVLPGPVQSLAHQAR
jgi:hypothetical protein